MEMPPGHLLDFQFLVEEAIAKGQPNAIPPEMKYEHASLFVAVMVARRYDLAERLLELGATVSNDDVCQIFWWSAGPEDVLFLGNHGISFNDDCLRIALQREKWDTIFALIDTGISVELSAPLKGGSPPKTLLQSAIYRDQLGILQQILWRGAETEVLDAQGMTPLMNLCQSHYLWDWSSAGKVYWLLKYGANPNVKTPEGETPLLLRVKERIERSKYLLRQHIIEVLLNYKADPNMVSPAGTTALMLAARDNDAPLIRSLLNAGADRTMRSPDGKAALDVAVKWNAREAIKQLGQ